LNSEQDSEEKEKIKNRSTVVSASFLSYDTVDIQEERSNNSNKARIWLLVFVGTNVVLNVWLLIIYLNVRDMTEVSDDYWSTIPFGFSDNQQIYRTFPLFLLALYSIMILIYFPLLIKILNMFKMAYPEDYYHIRGKLLLFLGIYELFLFVRTLDYAD
jgi:hypothetical protein